MVLNLSSSYLFYPWVSRVSFGFPCSCLYIFKSRRAASTNATAAFRLPFIFSWNKITPAALTITIEETLYVGYATIAGT